MSRLRNSVRFEGGSPGALPKRAPWPQFGPSPPGMPDRNMRDGIRLRREALATFEARQTQPAVSDLPKDFQKGKFNFSLMFFLLHLPPYHVFGYVNC